MKILLKLFRYITYIFFRPIWWLERFIPRNKNIWVFGACYGQKYSDNSKWLYEYVLEHEPTIKAIWITKNFAVYKKLRSFRKPVAMSSSFSGIWSCLRAKYAFLTSGVVDINAFVLNGCKQIWLWHGMPLKKIGYCEACNSSKCKQALLKLLNPYFELKPYSTITSSDFFTPFLKNAFKLPDEKIWKTGLPRCDAFFSNQTESFISKLHLEFPNSKVLLYMPTFRMNSNMDGIPFSPFVKDYGFYENEFSNFLETQNLIILFKPHFVDSEVKVEISSKRFRYITDDDFKDLYILLNSVDGLLTDYSSVYFDFLATKKPIYLLTFDYEEYTKKSRAHFFNMFEEMHAPICKNWREFYKHAENYRNKNDVFVSLENDHAKFAELLDGKSCEKLVSKNLGIDI